MWVTLDTERFCESKRSTVAWSLVSRHFLLGLNSSDHKLCGLSLLLALYLAPKSFFSRHSSSLSLKPII